jgi:hypothetical protein
MLGIEEEYEHFDVDIIVSINTCFSILNQLGVGPDNGFSIIDKTSVWTDWEEDMQKYNEVKTYVYLKTRLIFDPPQNSSLSESFNKLISEIEWRLNCKEKYIPPVVPDPDP